MSLRFHPFFGSQQRQYSENRHQRASSLESQQQGQTLVISLIDLKPQQLPIPERQFINKRKECFQDQWKQQARIQKMDNANQSKNEGQAYQNIDCMLWVSEPIELKHLLWLKEDEIRGTSRLPQNKVFVKYFYLPPVSEYMKEYSQKLKRLSSQKAKQGGSLQQCSNGNFGSITNSTISSSSCQLSHQTQMIIEQRHQVMYCLARELSSALVFDFGSKYIRFDHEAFQDLKEGVFSRFSSTCRKDFPKRCMSEVEKIPYYVVIKSSSYSSQRDFQVYKVKVSSNNNHQGFGSGSFRSNSSVSSNNISMEIDSKSVMPVKKTQSLNKSSDSMGKTNKQKQQSFGDLADMSVKLLQLAESAVNQLLRQDKLNSHRQQQIQSGKAILSNRNTHKQEQQMILSETSFAIANQANNTFDIYSDTENSTQSLSSIIPIVQQSYLHKQDSKSGIQNKQFNGKNSNIFLSKQSAKWIRPIQFNLFMQILIYYTGKGHKNPYQIGKCNQNLVICKQAIMKALCYYTVSLQMRDKLRVGKKKCQSGKSQSKQQSGEGQKVELMTSANDRQEGVLRSEIMSGIFTDMMLTFGNRQDSEQRSEGWISQYVAFTAIEELQKYIVDFLVDRYQCKKIMAGKSEGNGESGNKLRQLIESIYKHQELSVSEIEIGFIQRIYCNMTAFIQSHLVPLMKNQYQQFVQNSIIQLIPNKQTHSTPDSPQQCPNSLTSTVSRVPVLDIEIPSQIKKNVSQKIYSILQQKLSSYNIQYSHYLPLIFSHPVEVQFLKTTISSKDSHIHQFNQQIALLEIQLQQKQSLIEQQQSQIHHYKLDETFYKQVLNELNQTHSQLDRQTQLKKKITIDLQCAQILNIQANDTIQTHQLKEARLLEEKQNFLEAISHLSKENQHYITLSHQLQSIIESLNKKIDHYQLVDLQINSLKLENQQLKEENESIKIWRQTVEQSHKELIRKEVHKFNQVLKMNFAKFQQQQFMSKEMTLYVNELSCKLKNQTKNCALLQQEINYLKSKYFHSSQFTFDFSDLPNHQLPIDYSIVNQEVRKTYEKRLV